MREKPEVLSFESKVPNFGCGTVKLGIAGPGTAILAANSGFGYTGSLLHFV
jgi:hypothetical protein